MIDICRHYVELKYRLGGRDRPEVDCYGLYRLFVGEQFGIWLDEYTGHTSSVAITKKLVKERAQGNWYEIARMEQMLIYKSTEKVGDLVLMQDILGRGEKAIALPFHCGVLIAKGIVMEMLDGKGVLARSFKHINVAHRILGIYRPAALQ